MSAIPRHATYADLEAVPPHLVAEIIHGALVTHPRPFPRHQRAIGELEYELKGPFDRGRGGPGGWLLLTEPEVHLGRHVLVPDIAGWRRERVAALSGDAHIATAPDWVCEVLSTSTSAWDRGPKRDIYAEFGVEWLWFADPRDRTLEVLRLVESRWMSCAVHRDAEIVRAPPFDAISFSLGVLWPFDPPPSDPTREA